jgi:hypothetical protein
LKSEDPDPSEDEGAIVEFFGQLWLVPEDRSPRISKSPRVRPGEGKGVRLVWIAREKWRNRDFEPEECFPVGDRDWWIEQPKKFDFAEQIWGKGKKKTFVQAVKSMVGRGRGGRGPRPRIPEGDWEGWGEGYQYPPPYPAPHPPFYQPPPMYGFPLPPRPSV